MAIRTALLNGNVINRDADFSKYIETVSEAGVIEWLAVTSNSVATWKCRVPCERTNGDSIFALVYITTAQSISWNWDVYVQVSQEIIDNWELWNEDWTGIATVNVWTMPSKNALKLATISSWVVTDARNIIKTNWELNTLIQQNIEDIEDLDERVEALEEAGAIDHLEESAVVGELYTLNDTLFKQYTPTLENSTLNCNVSDTSTNKQIHIQRIGSWVASNQLKLKVKMVWSSTQNLIVEVRKWVQVTVTANSEAYWYWNQVIASWSISYSNISTSYTEKTVTLNWNFWWTEWELLDIVVYMNTVNASNYYCVACDGTQYSEWFSYVSVNGTTRTRSKLMPYCISDGFTDSMICKIWNGLAMNWTKSFTGQSTTGTQTMKIEVRSLPKESTITTGTMSISMYASWSSYWYLKANYWINDTIYRWQCTSSNRDLSWSRWDNPTWTSDFWTLSLGKNDTLYIWYTCSGGVTSASIWDFSITYNFTLDKKWETQWKPKSVSSIWSLGIISIFWVIEKEFYLWEETQTASTGSITPWNFVWYIQVWKYKIPYYL